MRTKKQKQASNRNFQLMMLLGMKSNLQKMQSSTNNDYLKPKINTGIHVINVLINEIKDTSIEDWNEQ